MDQLHEELKEPVMEYENGVAVAPIQGTQIQIFVSIGFDVAFVIADDPAVVREASSDDDEDCDEADRFSSQSEEEYETCDSGVSERSSLSASDEGEQRRSSHRRYIFNYQNSLLSNVFE